MWRGLTAYRRNTTHLRVKRKDKLESPEKDARYADPIFVDEDGELLHARCKEPLTSGVRLAFTVFTTEWTCLKCIERIYLTPQQIARARLWARRRTL